MYILIKAKKEIDFMDINDPINSIFLADLKSRERTIQSLILKIRRRLSTAPEGALRIIKKRKGFQYYFRATPSDSLGRYIPRKDHNKAVKLAQKDYDTKLIAVLEEQLKTIEDFINTFDPDAFEKIYEKLSEPRKALIDKGFLTDEEYVKQWLAVPYKKLGFKKDDPEYYTARGERVRSKSEILIADALARYNIPYKYECPFYIDGIPVAAPDFNCLNVRLRQDYYWEHLGMMGKTAYADNNVKKLEKYTLADNFNEEKLILTFETVNHPLNTKVIEAKIKRYLI